MGIRSALKNILGYSAAPSRTSSLPLPHPVTKEVMPEGVLLPHYRTFAGLVNAFSRVYSQRWDEALKRFPEDAQAMRRDCYLMALFDERTVPLSRWKWIIDDEEDEAGASKKDSKREEVRARAEAIARRTWRLHNLREYQREAVWFGKYGAQVAWSQEEVLGQPAAVITRHLPIHGDKIHTDFDGYDAVAINASSLGGHEFGDEITITDRMPVLRLRKPEWRQRFIIQKWRVRDGDYFNPYSAGQVGGIGLRHYVYWAWWLRDEMLSWATDFLEKVGSLGLLVVYYEEGNDQSMEAAKQTARDASNKNAIAVPVPKGKDPKTAGLDLIPANVSGAQFLKEFIGDYFERHIERMFVGQTLSGSSEGSGLGGTGVAKLHMDTKFQLLSSDAECFDAGYTEDLVRPIMALNFPGVPYRFRWKHILPDPESEARLNAAATFVGMGGELEEDEVRELAGFRKPAKGAKTLGGSKGLGGMQPPGEGQPAPGGGEDPDGGGTDSAGAPQEGIGGEPVEVAEGDQESVPGMAELVMAMMEAAAEGDTETVNRLAEIGENPGELEELLGGYSGGIIGYSGDWEPPGQGRKNWRKAKPGGGYIYSPTKPGERDPKAEKPQDLARRLKAEREPGRQEAREAWKQAAENPASIRPEQLGELAEQLNRLTRDELRETLRGMNQRVGGLKRDLVDRMLTHARSGREGEAGGEAKLPQTREEYDAVIAKRKEIKEAAQPEIEKLKTEILKFIQGKPNATREDVYDAFGKPGTPLPLSGGFLEPNEVNHVIESLEQLEKEGKLSSGKAGGMERPKYTVTDGRREGESGENWVRGNEPKIDRETFNSLPSAEYTVGELVIVWGSFGPLRGVVESTEKNSDGETVYRVVHPQNAKAGNYSSLKTGRLVRRMPTTDGPQEGDRDANGLVFRDGRWRREEEAGGAAGGEGQESQAAPAAKKEPWEMTFEELEDSGKRLVYDTSTKQYVLKPLLSGQRFDARPNDHARIVAAALAAGKPVPPEVLADYPDLAEKYGKQQDTPQEAPQDAKKTPVDIKDHKSMSDAAHQAGMKVVNWRGDMPGTESWNTHQPMISDVYDQMVAEGSLSPDVTLDQFKEELMRAHAAGVIRLSRIDMVKPQIDRFGLVKIDKSEIKNLNAQFHRINIPTSYNPKPGS